MSTITLRTKAAERPSGLGAPAATAGQDCYVGRLLDLLRDVVAPVLTTPHGSWSGSRLVDDVQRAAGALAEAGAGPGRVVAILTVPNHPTMIIARYAAHLLGATVVHVRSMNPRTDADELPEVVQRKVLDDTHADLLVVDAECAERGRQLVSGRARTRLLTDLAGARRVRTPMPVDPGACAVIDFTSGTSAAPRLVVQTFGARQRLVERLAADDQPGACFLSVTPVSHTTAPMLDAVLWAGGRVLLHPGFDPEAVLQAIDEGVTDVYLAVPHLYALLEHPGATAERFARMRRVIYSGTPAAPTRVARAAEIFGDAVVQVYGTTETGGISALTAADHAEPTLHRTVGRPFPWVSVDLRDVDSGRPVAPGEIGEVWVRSDTLSAGYWKDEQLTAGQLRDGWFCTGDLGCFDDYGYLRLVGRTGGVIKQAGLKVYPSSVEEALLGHPAVSEAVVQGVRDRDRRETVQAVVVTRPGAVATEQELIDHVAAQLSPAHAPTRIVFWSGIPLTQSGKPNRGVVRQLLGA